MAAAESMPTFVRKPLELRQWIVVLIVVVVVLPLVAYFAVPWDVWTVYCRYLKLPSYEEALGFRLGQVRVVDTEGAEPYHTVGIIEVSRSGAFAQLGFRPGDALLYYENPESGFYGDLDAACRETVRIKVRNATGLLVNSEVRRIALSPATMPARLCR